MTAPKLMSAAAWLRKYFLEGDAPHPKTVRQWVEDQLIPGRIMGKLTFVDEAGWLAQGAVAAAAKDVPPQRASCYRR